METKSFDWKDVANSQFDKAFAFAILLLLLCMMATPRVDVQKQKFSVEQMIAIELPPDERIQMKPPDIAKPVIDIQISEELASDSSGDLELQDLALKKFLNDLTSTNVNNKAATDDRPFEFVPYEDPPVAISQKAPEYTDFSIKSGIQGTVVLEVDVYRDGSIGKINVKRSLLPGPGGLDEAAINAVKKWKFQPGKSGGKAVDTTVIIPVEFSLTRN